MFSKNPLFLANLKGRAREELTTQIKIGHDRDMTELQVHQALVLQTLPFQEEHLIVTLFTHRLGLVKTLVKYRKKQPAALLEPFSFGEFTLYKHKSDLYHFQEGLLLENHLFLRNNLSTLQAAGKMVSALLKTQLPEKPGDALLSLILCFFQLLPNSHNPAGVLSIFYLKLLKHEGVLQLHPHCAECGIELNKFFRWKGELYCEKHAPLAYLFFEEAEEKLIHKLSKSKKSQELLDHLPQLSLIDKIDQLFEQALSF